ncbi:MAG: DUF4846 domain-containing protein, partial [Flavobacteriales bacterium]
MRSILIAGLAGCTLAAATGPDGSTIGSRFHPPPGFTRLETPAAGFAAYLRALPLKPEGAPVLLHNGGRKHRQDAHAAVVDMSVGPKDLQQCADAVMRLRAEHLFAAGRQDRIAFHFTSGFLAEWKRWRWGERIRAEGARCTWHAGARADSSHAELLRFLDVVFTYAGTRSLAKELVPAAEAPLAIGDVFIQAGSPGHAVIVVDAARHPDGRIAFLLAQSYMPAQEIHVLRNLRQPGL